MICTRGLWLLGNGCCPHCGCSLFTKFLLLLELLVQLSSRRILQDQVHTSTVIEVSIETKNIGVSGGEGVKYKVSHHS